MLSAIHESAPFKEASGPTLRPGGLELTDRAALFCRFPVGSELLDVGCGNGVTVQRLRDGHGCNACGIDTSPLLIAEGLERDPTLSLRQARAEALPFADHSLDGIFCECVLSLLPDPVQALKEFHRTLRPGGKLVISDLYLLRDQQEAEQGGDHRQGSGITSSRDVRLRLSLSGFNGLLFWEDHTRKLTELAARIMLAHGSLACLAELGDCSGGKPGYYLLVTEKQTSGN